jgi:hypothetical protein
VSRGVFDPHPTMDRPPIWRARVGVVAEIGRTSEPLLIFCKRPPAPYRPGQAQLSCSDQFAKPEKNAPNMEPERGPVAET